MLYVKDFNKHKNISCGEGLIEMGALKKISRGSPASEFMFPAGVRFDAPDKTVLTGTLGKSEKVIVVEGKLEARGNKTVYPVTLSAGWTQKNQMQKWFQGKKVIDSKGQVVKEFYFHSSGKLKCIKEKSKITSSTFLLKYGMVSEQTKYLTRMFSKPMRHGGRESRDNLENSKRDLHLSDTEQLYRF